MCGKGHVTDSPAHVYPQKRKGRQCNSTGIHWKRWSLSSTSAVKTGAVTLKTFPFQCRSVFWSMVNLFLYSDYYPGVLLIFTLISRHGYVFRLPFIRGESTADMSTGLILGWCAANDRETALLSKDVSHLLGANLEQDCFLQKEARVCVSNAFVMEDSKFKWCFILLWKINKW